MMFIFATQILKFDVKNGFKRHGSRSLIKKKDKKAYYLWLCRKQHFFLPGKPKQKQSVELFIFPLLTLTQPLLLLTWSTQQHS